MNRKNLISFVADMAAKVATGEDVSLCEMAQRAEEFNFTNEEKEHLLDVLLSIRRNTSII